MQMEVITLNTQVYNLKKNNRLLKQNLKLLLKQNLKLSWK